MHLKLTTFSLVCAMSVTAWGQETEPLSPPPAPPTVEPTASPSAPSADAPRSLGLFRGTERFEWQSPMPAGFREERALRKGLLITGSAVFGGLYLYTLATALSSGMPLLAVPVVGPIVVGGQAVANPGGSLPFFSSVFGVAFIAAGVLQAAGITLAVLGVALPVKWLERERPAVSLRVSASPGGVQLAGVF